MAARVVKNIEDQLMLDEGAELRPYPDPRSPLGKACAAARLKLVQYKALTGWQALSGAPWTIGTGHNMGATIAPVFANGITEAQREALFDGDLHTVWDRLDVYLPWWSSLDTHSGPRSNVLVNTGFNLGVVGVTHFPHFLAFMRARQWGTAAALQASLVYAELPERYGRLCKQIETGEWQ